MKKRQNERGAAIIFVLIIAAVIFILLAVAVRGYACWQKTNKTFLNENRETARNIKIEA